MYNSIDNFYNYKQDESEYYVYEISEDGSLPYALVVPQDFKDGTEIIVESLNRESDKYGNIAGFDERSIERYIETVQRILKSVKKTPIIIPIVPSIDGEGYYQELSRDCIEGKTECERIDIQFFECIESAKRKIDEISGIKVADKVFLNGYSTSGVFAQRFALIHPEIVSKCCIGGAVGSIPIPEDKLPYPVGVQDFVELFGKDFDIEKYRQIQFAYYVAEHEALRPGEYGKDGRLAYTKVVDQNGTVSFKKNDESMPVMPMHDMSYNTRSMSTEIGKLYRAMYGETMQSRLDSAINYYTQNGYSFRTKIFRGVAHNDIRYESIHSKPSNVQYCIAYFGIFSNHPSVVDVSQRLYNDIATFYESGNGFESDDKSVSKLDLKEQEQRESDAQSQNRTKLEKLNDEQENLTLLLKDKQKKYEQMKNQVKGKEDYE